MRLKSFYAKTVTEAMQMVRDSLGEDAIIVATREEQGGKSVRVTAAVEQADRYGGDTALLERDEDDADPLFETGESEPDWAQYDGDDEANAVIEQLTDVMLRHGVADEITDQILSCASVMNLDSAEESLITALEHLYSFKALSQKGSGTAIMLIGPPGAGKTLAVAKLATRAVMGGKRVAVISTDTIRAGGIEQLSAFTNLLRIKLQKAGNVRDLRAVLESARGADQIYIDTGGINPFSAEEMRDVARLMAAGDIEPVLVMPAGIDADESGEIARAYATLGVRSLLPTRLDIARRLGGLLGAAHHGGLIFADASHTPKVAEGLITLSPQRLAQFLMPQIARSHRTTRRSKTG